MTDKNVVKFKRFGDRQRDAFKEMLDLVDPEECGIILMVDLKPDDLHGDFQIFGNYEPNIKELVALGALQDWLTGQVYQVEEE